MISVSEIENLNEDECRFILDFFAKKAYGKNAEIIQVKDEFDNEKYVFTIHFNTCQFYMIMFGIHSMHDGHTFHTRYDSCKTLLKVIAKTITAHPTAYVSYLPNTPHMIDIFSSLEEALVGQDLQ